MKVRDSNTEGKKAGVPYLTTMIKRVDKLNDKKEKKKIIEEAKAAEDNWKFD